MTFALGFLAGIICLIVGAVVVICWIFGNMWRDE